jgi:hypothetical protein
MRRICRALIAAGLTVGLGCTSNDAGSGTPGGGAGGAVSSGSGGASATGAGGAVGAGGSPGSGGAPAAGGAPGSGGAVGAGSGGSPGGADGGVGPGGAGGALPSGFTCNQVTAMTLTAEWYNAGFENGVVNDHWQLKAMEHGYITEWANPNSTFWQTPITSACAQGTDSPDRIVLTVLSWTITTQADWDTQITAAVADLMMKYPGVKRIDLLTVIRGPGNKVCPTPPAAGETIAMPPELDAAIAAVAARNPGFVFAGPKFEAPDCSYFSGGGPHLTSAGNMMMAKMISAYFANLQ